MLAILKSAIAHEDDVVAVRQRSKRIAAEMGFDPQDQTRIATAVSEIVRNAFRYAGGGTAEFLADLDTPQRLVIRISDKGPGIPNLDDILEGRYQSETGMGMGLVGARRLMDGFELETAPGKGTTITLAKALLRRGQPLAPADIRRVGKALADDRPGDTGTEVAHQNRELLAALAELNSRQEELVRLNGELEDTNRGVVALYAELDEKADQLRRANDLKTKFLANMSHEFRTPLNSIMALSRLLLDRVDGELTPEQEKQVTLIRRSAENLTELVNDLLDIAKVEAGKVDLRPTEFTAAELFGGLRGALKPLQSGDAVDLIFEDPTGVPPLFTDEGKLSQVLRNFVSNALKFTEQGEIRVAARFDAAGGRVTFSVRDTGIGIAAEHHERIFQEFAQVENRLQAKVKGTGLGLPLSRRLAELMGGRVWVESEPGRGSTFHLEVPARLEGARDGAQDTASDRRGGAPRLLVIDDEEADRYVVRQTAQAAGAEVSEARGGVEGIELARTLLPDMIFLDIRMPGLTGFDVIAELGRDPLTTNIPVIICTSSVLDPKDMARLARAAAIIPKGELTRDAVSALVRTILDSP
ncbi:MAG TPA: ATP-binding protein [Azospirillaceae bacterium]|nr:ATP-binding protein [Azospirillaceae bacterium]